MRPRCPLVLGSMVGPWGAAVAFVGVGVGVDEPPGIVGAGVGVLPVPGLLVAGLVEIGAPGFCGALPGVDEPPPPPHAVSATTTINVASADARRNAECSNVWPLVEAAYGATAVAKNVRSGDDACAFRHAACVSTEQALHCDHRSGSHEKAASSVGSVRARLRDCVSRRIAEPAPVAAAAAAASRHHRQPSTTSTAGFVFPDRSDHGRLARLRTLAEHGYDRRLQYRSSAGTHRASLRRCEHTVQDADRAHVRDRVPRADDRDSASDTSAYAEVVVRDH